MALQIEQNILLWIQQNIRQEWMNGFWKGITMLGNAGWFWIVTAVLLLFFAKTRKAGFTALLSLLIGFVITNLLLKNMVARTRPFNQNSDLVLLIKAPLDYSFPSGHTCASFACALVYLRMLPKKFGIPAVVLAAMIAFSRLYVGAHYPTDVLGGFVIALIASLAAVRLAPWIIQKNKQNSR